MKVYNVETIEMAYLTLKKLGEPLPRNKVINITTYHFSVHQSLNYQSRSTSRIRYETKIHRVSLPNEVVNLGS